MAKSGGKGTVFVLRLSGLVFAAAGSFHVLRYFRHYEFRVAGFELTYLGSLVIGLLALSLSAACFAHARK